MTALRYGIVGAGPWARDVHVPGALLSDRVELTALWARRPQAAAELGAPSHVEVVSELDELFDRVDVVGFAVPPDVQFDLAMRAAKAGKHVLLEKPISFDPADARVLAAEISTRRLANVVFFTAQLDPARAAWNKDVRAHGATIVEARSLSRVLLEPDNPFGASPWRHKRGSLWDAAAHDIAQLILVLGPVVEVTAAQGPGDLTVLTTRHAEGGRGLVSTSMDAPAEDGDTFAITSRGVERPPAVEWLDLARRSVVEALGIISDRVDSPSPHPLEVRLGVQVVDVMDAAQRSAADGVTIRLASAKPLITEDLPKAKSS